MAFESSSTNLVANDTNDRHDIFVHDRLIGVTERVSVATSGEQANNFSFRAAISADGRFVAFESLATNLVAGHTGIFTDVFVRDRQTGTTELVSVGPGGVQADSASVSAAISADGRFVAFESNATNLVAGDTNGFYDAFVRDRLSGTTERVSVATGGTEGNQIGFSPSISSDGRYVAFTSYASNLVAGDANASWDVFVRDRLSATTARVSVDSSGAEANEYSYGSSISADGRFVAFVSLASNLVASDTNGIGDVFLHDRQSGATQRASVDASGAQGNLRSDGVSISADGLLLVFWSDATNLVPGDTNAVRDIFVRDRQHGITQRVSVSGSGAQADYASYYRTSISSDGRIVAFESEATNLVAGDTNLAADVFVRDRAGPPPAPFCFGDGTGSVCPCGNGAPGNGCPNSVNAAGGNLTPSGLSSTTADTLVLSGSGMPDSFALYFQGTSQVAGGNGAPFGDGLRCVAGAVVRLGTEVNIGGVSRYPGPGDASVSTRGLVTVPGVRTYQVWYRNAAAFCTSATFNLTNGSSVTWTL